jgi:hypothetical protein
MISSGKPPTACEDLCKSSLRPITKASLPSLSGCSLNTRLARAARHSGRDQVSARLCLKRSSRDDRPHWTDNWQPTTPIHYPPRSLSSTQSNLHLTCSSWPQRPRRRRREVSSHATRRRRERVSLAFLLLLACAAVTPILPSFALWSSFTNIG